MNKGLKRELLGTYQRAAFLRWSLMRYPENVQKINFVDVIEPAVDEFFETTRRVVYEIEN